MVGLRREGRGCGSRMGDQLMDDRRGLRRGLSVENMGFSGDRWRWCGCRVGRAYGWLRHGFSTRRVGFRRFMGARR